MGLEKLLVAICFNEQFDVDEEEIDMLKVLRPISFSLCYLLLLRRGG